MTHAPSAPHPTDYESAERSQPERFSLNSRVTLLAAFSVGIAVALVSLAAYLTVRNSLSQDLDDSLLRRVDAAANSAAIGSTMDSDIPRAILDATETQVGLIRAGASLADVKVKGFPLSQTELDVVQGKTQRSQPRTDNGPGGKFRVVAESRSEGLAVFVAVPMAPMENTLHRLGLVLVLVGGAGIILAAVAGAAVARAGLVPIQRLTAGAEHVARTGDLRPIPIAGDDELARLTQSFNTMLGALAESQERQRRLVADAGHELRTPLTSLRTNVELLVASSKPGARTLPESDRAEIYDDVRAQINELSTLVGDLVELAREDAPQVVHEPVDMVGVIERAVDRAGRRGTNVTFDVDLQPWTLLGDANALERAALNLLDNAVKYSPAGGTVSVRLVQVGDGTAALQVADQGPGIAAEDMPHVFERFYRSSEARTLPGSGLGLAIVKQVAVRHGGAVFVGRAVEGGALLTVQLPGRPGMGE
ncbi:sensor histidine kinase [Pseudonocardiaceae bacterium YIM PH 21723]|nr:sensor histidine kinase [Pseudonocardiaceae bacterium YIM PH 21723]